MTEGVLHLAEWTTAVGCVTFVLYCLWAVVDAGVDAVQENFTKGLRERPAAPGLSGARRKVARINRRRSS